MSDKLIGMRLGSEMLSEMSLVAVFETAATMMRSIGMPEAAIVAAKQQFFIGADASLRILDLARETNDGNIITKLEKEIKANLIVVPK